MKKRILVIMLGAMLALSGCGAAKENPETAVSTEMTEDKEAENKAEQNEASKPAEEATETAEAKGESKAEETTETSKAKDESKTEEATETAEAKDENKTDDAAADKDKTKADSSDKKSDSTENVKSSESKSEDSKETKKEESTKTEAATTSDESTKTETPAKTEESPKAETPANTAPAKPDYGRIVFIGDSRTVDMFSGDVSRIYGELHDGMTVYAEDARDYSFLIEVISSVGTENFDTLVSWMGANDYGNFSNYQPHYEGLLREGKRLILCTVGPTMDSALASDFDRSHYTNDLQIAYNNSLVAWANANGVKVIDLYSYLAGNTDITLDPADGIHYQPRPTGAIWGRIVSGMY